MSDWRSLTSDARDAAAVMLRDRTAGEAAFERLFRAYPNDGMLFLERGKALSKLGDVDRARSDLQRALRLFPKPEWRRQAEIALQALGTGSTVAKPAAQVGVASVTPAEAELSKAHDLFRRNECRAVDFDAAARLLQQALDGTHNLSPTVPVAFLLQSWNFAYYQGPRRFDESHYRRLDAVLREDQQSLEAFRPRSIASLSASDQDAVKARFESLSRVVGRVGAAKVLHLWAPEFFPLWDNPIAQAYGFDLTNPASQYWEFMLAVQKQVVRMQALEGVSPLKLLDEFNYCRFTKRWMD